MRMGLGCRRSATQSRPRWRRCARPVIQAPSRPVRERFALLGERWVLTQDSADARRARTSSDVARQRAEARAAELGVSRPAWRSLALALAEARNWASILEQELAATNDGLAAQRAALTELRQVEMSGWRAWSIAAEERRDTLGKCLGVADERARTSRQRLGMSDHRLRMVEAEACRGIAVARGDDTLRSLAPHPPVEMGQEDYPSSAGRCTDRAGDGRA